MLSPSHPSVSAGWLVPGPPQIPKSEDIQVPCIKWHSIAGPSHPRMQKPKTERTNCSVRIGLNYRTRSWSQRISWMYGIPLPPWTHTYMLEIHSGTLSCVTLRRKKLPPDLLEEGLDTVYGLAPHEHSWSLSRPSKNSHTRSFPFSSIPDNQHPPNSGNMLLSLQWKGR